MLLLYSTNDGTFFSKNNKYVHALNVFDKICLAITGGDEARRLSSYVKKIQSPNFPKPTGLCGLTKVQLLLG